MNKLNETAFVKCTSDISSFDEGTAWKEEQCKKSRGSWYHKKAKEKCAAKGVQTKCAQAGLCFKNKDTGDDVCRFCFR